MGGWGAGGISFVAVAAAVQVFALQVAAGVADAGDLAAEAVHAPADAPLPAPRRLALQMWRESKG